MCKPKIIISTLIALLVVLPAFSKEKYVIGFSQCSQGEWRKNMEAEMQRELMFHPDIEMVIKQSGDDNALQITQVRSFVTKKVDLLIIAPNEIVAIQPVIEEAFHSGIPIVLIDRKIDSEQYTAYVGGDNYDIGKSAAQYLANKLKNQGEIIEIMGALSSSPARERTKGFNHLLKHYPDLINQKRLQTRWDVQTINDSLPLILKNYPNVKAIYAHTDFMAEAASNLVLQHLPGKEIFIVGIDGLPDEGGGIELVENGVITASLIYPTGGKEAIQVASRILHEEPFDKNNLLPTTMVDQTNVGITRLQFQNINALQEDITKSRRMLEMLGGRYKTAQLLLFITLLLFISVAFLLVLYFRAFNHKKAANVRLERQKEEILSQNNELKRLSDELEKVTQERLRFYTNISHEFRTPLTLISGPVENLVKHENITTEQKDLLRVARKNIEILLRLIEQIIDFRKYELGKHGFNPVSADLKKHFLEWNELFSEVSKQKKIEFHLETTSDKSFIVDFDVEKMERIYTNLLSNAFKFTPERGQIKVILKREQTEGADRIKVEVRNSGKVISQNDIQNIFDRFYQAGSKTGGSGIGLALVKGYVELHNGIVDVKNRNGFICFSFSFPALHAGVSNKSLIKSILDDEDVVIPGKNTDEIIEQISGGDELFIFDEFDEKATSILLVDDHPGIRSYLKSLLKDEYCVLEARDGIEGIKKAIKYVPDIIISDVMMPGIDGVEMCNHLKKEISTSHIPIILLTANVQDEKRILGFESGADAYISKPVNFEILEVRIRKLIEGRKKLKAIFGKDKFINEKLQEKNSIEKSFIDKLEESIEKHIQDIHLNVDFLSRELGMSRIQLYRKVKALTNYSPVEFLTIYRLKKAVHLMTITELTLAEIAYQVGFSAPSYFSKSFKKYYGKSPSEYLKEIRNK